MASCSSSKAVSRASSSESESLPLNVLPSVCFDDDPSSLKVGSCKVLPVLDFLFASLPMERITLMMEPLRPFLFRLLLVGEEFSIRMEATDCCRFGSDVLFFLGIILVGGVIEKELKDWEGGGAGMQPSSVTTCLFSPMSMMSLMSLMSLSGSECGASTIILVGGVREKELKD